MMRRYCHKCYILIADSLMELVAFLIFKSMLGPSTTLHFMPTCGTAVKMCVCSSPCYMKSESSYIGFCVTLQARTHAMQGFI